MSILAKVGLLSTKEYHESMQRHVDEVNRLMAVELEKRAMLVDETLQNITNWRYDAGDLMRPTGGAEERQGVRIILDVPKSLLLGMTRVEPDIAGLAISRMIHLLRIALQKAVSQIVNPHSGEASTGSYL